MLRPLKLSLFFLVCFVSIGFAASLIDTNVIDASLIKASLIEASVIDTSVIDTSLIKAKDDRSFELRQEFSWIKDIKLHAETLSQAHQIDAKAIVEAATNAALQSQQCEVAKTLANKAKEMGRKSLELEGREESVRYPKLLVFVSFSIPLETLKAIGSQVNKVGGKLVFRGLINGSFKETIEKLKELQEEVIIDPPLFETFNVKNVPTFVLRQERSMISLETGAYDRLQGNVSLHYALEQFALKENEDARALLQQLRSAL